MKKLHYIFRASLQNETTQAVIAKAFDKNKVPLPDKMQDYTWAPEADGFYAILATDNCKSIPFLLKDHLNALGKKKVTKIVTHWTSYLYLAVES